MRKPAVAFSSNESFGLDQTKVFSVSQSKSCGLWLIKYEIIYGWALIIECHRSHYIFLLAYVLYMSSMEKAVMDDLFQVTFSSRLLMMFLPLRIQPYVLTRQYKLFYCHKIIIMILHQYPFLRSFGKASFL